MSQYNIYRFKYLAYKLESIIWDDLMKESYFISDIINRPVKKIEVLS